MTDKMKIPELRSLSLELVNLKEEFFSDPTDKILDNIYARQNPNLKNGNENTPNSAPLPAVRPVRKDKKPDMISDFFGFNVFGVWGVLLFLCLAVWIQIFRVHGFKPKTWMGQARKWECLIDNAQGIQEMARPPVSCKICSGLDSFPIEPNGISKEDFLKKYAYTMVPVVIRGAVKNWTAVDVFSHEYFRDLYSSFKDGFEVQEDRGQFFGYKTEFGSLEEALLMSKQRMKKPWYFGWSNDHPEIGKILRKHYQRPNFIPDDCGTAATDWIFMGTPNRGAHMHLDYVGRPSWQAQIKGTKQWFIQPSAECQHVCKDINVTVSQGDIIVLDTNQWFHSTFTHPSDISVTIGSEYD